MYAVRVTHDDRSNGTGERPLTFDRGCSILDEREPGRTVLRG